MIMRPFWHILLVICMAPTMLGGLGSDRVLCIGANGHIAIEAAAIAGEITCCQAGAISASDETKLPMPLILSSCRSCGQCSDFCGTSQITASGGEHHFAGIAAGCSLPPASDVVLPAFDHVICLASAWPPATPPGGRISARAAVLLI